MLAVKGRFDGRRILLSETPDVPSCRVIVVFEHEAAASDPQHRDWMRVQEGPLAAAWDNDEDAVYDSL